jgi:hypothetical protein
VIPIQENPPMSTVLVVTPLIIAGWPVMTAAISAAVGTLGFAVAQADARQHHRRILDTKTRTEIDVEESEILAGTAGSGEEMVVERDGVRAVFSRDSRGALRLCLEGDSRSKAELRRLGEELIGRVTQQYAYHRVVSELKERQMNIVEERVAEDQSITIRVRHS